MRNPITQPIFECPYLILQLENTFQISGLSALMQKYQKTMPHINETGKSLNRTQYYFSKLNKKQLLELYHKYKQDFELFDYSIEPYLSYTKD